MIVSYNFLTAFVLIASGVLSVQGLFTLMWMLYSWESHETASLHKSPREYHPPKLSFTALIPARHEEKVIEDTIIAVHNIDYPNHLKEIIILCRSDDPKTINKAYETLQKIKDDNVRIFIFDDLPINKPHALNHGLREAKNEIIAVFDAEDEPHPHIYQIINTKMIESGADVVQSGIQLMNYRDRWFSALNCIEYFFWFRSGLIFFTDICGATPLGGNTVFFKRHYLHRANGWDENCLTEDADIGIKISRLGAKISVLYDEEHVTREESPQTVTELVKQRTRWNQGFIQVFYKGEWFRLPKFKQKVITFYILLSPIFQALMFLYLPIAIIIAFTVKLSVFVSLISFLPLFIVFINVAVTIVGVYEFSKAYKLPFPFWMPLKIALTFLPYQILLMVSSLRALYRHIFNLNAWEKTMHINAHRLKTI